MTSASEAITYLQNTTATINGDDSSTSTSSSSSSIDSQTFLNLMCMQLEYQDPTDPIDTSEMLAQEAQFASLEALETLTSSFSEFSTIYQANSLLGQYVEVTDSSGNTEYGYVEYVYLNDSDGASVYVNDTLVPLDQITKVIAVDDEETTDSDTSDDSVISALTESISDLIEKLTEYLSASDSSSSESDS